MFSLSFNESQLIKQLFGINLSIFLRFEKRFNKSSFKKVNFFETKNYLLLELIHDLFVYLIENFFYFFLTF